eukprot:TRINITY_DN16371_c0_g1_i1.p3 TRINITY_DN16371_c0_g1~~TRINITY_DN16371_c0_g1_i1.p3  ORF type:complete len:129 (+),score=22.51 TRINITY_DN16371_c0_g1_i1:353-739(+)
MMRHGDTTSDRERFATSYSVLCTDGRAGPDKPTAPVAWRTRPPRHDPVTGRKLRVAEAPFESVGAPSSRVSVNRAVAKEQRAGVLPAIDIVGMPRDRNLQHRGNRRKVRESVPLSSDGVPAFMVPADG